MPDTLRWSQLEPGAFTRREWTVKFGGLRLDRHAFNVGFKAEAAAVPGTCLIGVAGDERTDARWFGNKLGFDHIGTSDGALDLTTAGPSAFFYVAIDKRELARQFPETATICAMMDEASDVRVTEDPQQAGALREFLDGMLRASKVISNGSPVDARSNIRHTLLPMLALAFEEPSGDERPRSVTRRIAAVRTCEEYVNAHIDLNPSLLDLSNVCGLRLRSLINAFRAVTGLSPMAFLKLRRLNAVHDILAHADRSQTRIIDVAANWGFWHMGHFTSDYRNLFGETPSQTLRSAESPAATLPRSF